jgi:hypothetical protein
MTEQIKDSGDTQDTLWQRFSPALLLTLWVLAPEVRRLVDWVVGFNSLSAINLLPLIALLPLVAVCFSRKASTTRPGLDGDDARDSGAVHDLGAMLLIDLALHYRARVIFFLLAGMRRVTASRRIKSINRRPLPKRPWRSPLLSAAWMHASCGFSSAMVRRCRSRTAASCRPSSRPATNRQTPSIRGSRLDVEAMTYFRDAIKLLLLVADRPQAALRTIDIGSDDERGVDDIASAFGRTLGVTLDPTYIAAGPKEAQLVKTDLAPARALGRKPRTSLEDGLRVTYEWFARESRLFV